MRGFWFILIAILGVVGLIFGLGGILYAAYSALAQSFGWPPTTYWPWVGIMTILVLLSAPVKINEK